MCLIQPLGRFILVRTNHHLHAGTICVDSVYIHLNPSGTGGKEDICTAASSAAVGTYHQVNNGCWCQLFIVNQCDFPTFTYLFPHSILPSSPSLPTLPLASPVPLIFAPSSPPPPLSSSPPPLRY